MFQRILLSVLMLASLFGGRVLADPLPDLIVPNPPSLIAGPPPVAGHFMPEGVEFLNGFFYQGNIAQGDIVRVAPNGDTQIILPAGSDPLQQNVFGIDMDKARRISHRPNSRPISTRQYNRPTWPSAPATAHSYARSIYRTSALISTCPGAATICAFSTAAGKQGAVRCRQRMRLMTFLSPTATTPRSDVLIRPIKSHPS